MKEKDILELLHNFMSSGFNTSKKFASVSSSCSVAQERNSLVLESRVVSCIMQETPMVNGVSCVLLLSNRKQRCRGAIEYTPDLLTKKGVTNVCNSTTQQAFWRD